MILKNLFQNKRGLIQKSVMSIFVAVALFTLIYVSQPTLAGKADQYFTGNLTCEQITDGVLWTLLSAKSTVSSTNVSWAPETSCLGVKNCDMKFIKGFVRYANVGTKDFVAGTGLIRIANTTETTTLTRPTRHMAYLNS